MIEKVHIPLDQWMAMTPAQRGCFERQVKNFVIDLNFDHPSYACPDLTLELDSLTERKEMGMNQHEQDAWHNPRQTNHGGKL